MGRGGPEVRFHQRSTRVPPGFHQGSTRVPRGVLRGLRGGASTTACCWGCHLSLFSPTAESFGVSAQIGSGVGRGGPEVRFHQRSTRVPPGCHQGSTRVPPGFCEGCGVVRALKKSTACGWGYRLSLFCLGPVDDTTMFGGQSCASTCRFLFVCLLPVGFKGSLLLSLLEILCCPTFEPFYIGQS